LPGYVNVADSKVRIGNYDMANNVFWNAVSACNSLFQKEKSQEPLDLTGRIAELLSRYKCLGIILRRSSLYHTDLYRANLYRADLRSANLSDSDLYGANLSDTILYYADLSDADLRGAQLHYAKLRGTNLENAKVTRSQYVYIYLRDSRPRCESTQSPPFLNMRTQLPMVVRMIKNSRIRWTM